MPTLVPRFGILSILFILSKEWLEPPIPGFLASGSKRIGPDSESTGPAVCPVRVH